MDQTLCDYDKSYEQTRLIFPELNYPQSKPGFFENLEPISGALDTYNWLKSLKGNAVYILSAPSELNPLSYTEKRIWVEKHLGLDQVSKLIISPNKGLNKGDYLIDDYISGKGQENFEGKVLQFGSSEFPDWVSIKEYFMTIL